MLLLGAELVWNSHHAGWLEGDSVPGLLGEGARVWEPPLPAPSAQLQPLKQFLGVWPWHRGLETRGGVCSDPNPLFSTQDSFCS